MEIISIYCFIAFILGAVFMLIIHCIVAMGKVKEPMNKVHFYVARDMDGELWLYLGKPIRGTNEFYCGSDERAFSLAYKIDRFGLKKEDYDYLKWKDEPVEVFVNLED